jgi:HlyD family secretion protein
MVFKHTQQLRTITPDEFLPPISRWSTWGGLALLGVFGGAIALSALFKYNVTVKASAVIRPEGDLRIVEATAAGQVQQILVEPNDDVQQGETLVILDDAELRSRQQQIQTEIEQIQQQRSHIQQELIALDNQIAAEQQAGERAIAAAQAELEQRRQAYLDAQTTTAADVREAEAAVQFAQEELSRYQQLAGTGALADLQLQEKVAALETTQARLEKARGLSNPSHAAVSQAQENRQQTQQQALEQVDLELKTLTIRAPLAGTIQSISLRNPNQVLEAGEGIAQIAPNTDDLIIARVSTDSAGEKIAADDKFVSSLEAMLFFIKKHNPFSPEIH